MIESSILDFEVVPMFDFMGLAEFHEIEFMDIATIICLGVGVTVNDSNNETIPFCNE